MRGRYLVGEVNAISELNTERRKIMAEKRVESYDAVVRLRVNSGKHAELLAKAIRDMRIARPLIKFTQSDAANLMNLLHGMPELRMDEYG